MLYKRLIINGEEYPIAVNQAGNGAPSEATAGAPGVLYMDTDTEKFYKCTAAIDGVYTWKELGASGGSGSGGNVDLTGVVKSVNGVTPDENGNVEIAVSGGGGLTASARNLLISILRNGIYRDDFDVASTITALEAELAANAGGGGSGGDSASYTITNILTNVTNKNTMESVSVGSSYFAVLTPADDMEISSVIITMNGVDITKTAYADGVVTILAVTGNVVITAIAEEKLVDITQNADGTLLIIAAKSVTQNTNGTLLIA